MALSRVSLLAAFLLAGCGSGDDEPTRAPGQEAGPPPVAGAPADAAPFDPAPSPTAQSLAGEYRVAGIDGEDLDAPIGIAVSISPTTIELEPCAGFAWTYTYTGRRLETARIPVSGDEPTCRVEPAITRAGLALAEATRVTRTAANGLEFRGGGRSVLLFSQ